jgi:hypothetical protein
MSYTKGWKAFDAGLICRGFQFEEGKTYEVSGEPVLCSNGFHFCRDLVLTLEYYPNFEANVYAEVEAIGAVVYEDPTQHKACTNKIKIIKVYTKEEVASMVDGHRNSGDRNSGDRNSGHRNRGHGNSGDRNSGHGNSGHQNSGDQNSGHRNSGDQNSGHGNSGHGNSGDRNSGDQNSGHGNSGDWNSTNYETGCFNTKTVEIINVFNKPCSKELWDRAKKPDFLYFTLIRGKTYKESFQESFKNAHNRDIDLLKALPNFDAAVFFEISGIRIEE